MRILSTYYANIKNLTGNYVVVNIGKQIPQFEMKDLPSYHSNLLTTNPAFLRREKAMDIYKSLITLSIQHDGADILLCTFSKIDSHRAKIALWLEAHIGYLLGGDIIELPNIGRVVKMEMAA